MRTFLLTLLLVFVPTFVSAQPHPCDDTAFKQPPATRYTLGPITLQWCQAANAAIDGAIVYENGAVVPSSGFALALGANAAGTALYQVTVTPATFGTRRYSVAVTNRNELGVVQTSDRSEEIEVILVQPRPRPDAPRGLRTAPQNQSVSLGRAFELAQLYADLAIDRKLTDAELNGIAARYYGGLDKFQILGFLDLEYARLVR